MKRAILLLALVACGPKHSGTDPIPDPVSDPVPVPVPDPVPVPVTVDWSKSSIDWSKIPEPGEEPAFTPPVPVTFTLKNGIKVILVENHRLPLVSVRVIHTRAGAREDGKQIGLASLTADMIDEGAGTFDALTLPEAVETLGASLDTGVSEDASSVYLDTLASTLEDSLALLADVVLRPRLDEKDFERVRGDTIEELKLRPQEPRRVAALLFDKLVLPGHPYGEPPAGYLGTVEKLELADVTSFWKKHYVPAHATIVIAGDVDRKTLEPLLARKLGGWKGKKLPAAKAPKPPKKAPAPVLAFVDRPGAAQSVVMVGRRGRPATDALYYPAEVVNMAAGGSFAARLNNRLREQLGYTYGMFSSFWRGEWDGTWSVTSSLKTNVTVAGLEEALAILGKVRSEELPAGELAKAQQLMTRAVPQDFETNAGIAGQFASLVVQRKPLDWHQGYVAAVRAVTAADGRKVVEDLWTDLSIVVVGDWNAIGKDLAKLGLPIVMYDAEGNPTGGE